MALTVTIHLLKPSIQRPEDALRDEDRPDDVTPLVVGGAIGTLFTTQGEPHEPEWGPLINRASGGRITLETRGAGALIVLHAGGRWFALTFGTGRFLLDPYAYERRFGLRAALNAVDPEQLRTAHARTFNEFALKTHRQVARLSRFEALELDVERDLLTTLGGVIGDSSLGLRIEGRDSVRLTGNFDERPFVDRCARLLSLSQQTTYRAAFPWIDDVEQVTDPAEIHTLEHLAAERLGQRNFSGFDVFPPEVIGREIVAYATRPSRGGQRIIEPSEQQLAWAIHAPMGAQTARAALQHWRLIALDGSGDAVDRWPLWDCLHWETFRNGTRFVLDAGQWFRVAPAFATDVDAFIGSLGPSGLTLPAASSDQTEPVYNAAAGRVPGLTSLDANTIKLPRRSAVEACDLFADSGHMVHVKRRKGGSGPLSHMIAQAAVSAELLLTDIDFRDQLRAKLEAEQPGLGAVITEPPHAADLQVVLALMTNAAAAGSPANQLPFFTKVFLRQNVRRLQAMGFTVAVDEIPVSVLRVSNAVPRPSRRRRRPGAARTSVRRTP